MTQIQLLKMTTDEQKSNQESKNHVHTLNIKSVLGFVAQINFELGFSLTPYLSKDTLCRRRTQMSETV